MLCAFSKPRQANLCTPRANARIALRSLVLFVFLVEERTLQHEIGDGAIEHEQDNEHQKGNLFVDLRERSSDKVD